MARGPSRRPGRTPHPSYRFPPHQDRAGSAPHEAKLPLTVGFPPHGNQVGPRHSRTPLFPGPPSRRPSQTPPQIAGSPLKTRADPPHSQVPLTETRLEPPNYRVSPHQDRAGSPPQEPKPPLTVGFPSHRDQAGPC